MAPLPPPVPTTMAGNLPHEPPPVFSTEAPFRRFVRTGSPKDAFDISRENIEHSIREMQGTFHQWQLIASNTNEDLLVTKELLTSCDYIEWQVHQLEKTMLVALEDPAYYRLDEVELSRGRKLSGFACNQVGIARSAVEKGKSYSGMGTHQDLMGTTRPIHSSSQDDAAYISSESDSQLLLGQQNDELHEISESVQRVEDVGQTINGDLCMQLGRLEFKFLRWQQAASNTREYVLLTQGLLATCDSLEWQADKLEDRMPTYYLLNEVELPWPWKLTRSARKKVGVVRSAVEKGKSYSGTYWDLMGRRRTIHNSSEDNNGPDRQLLPVGQQDAEIHELSASVQRIGDVGLTIHDELSGQDLSLNQHDDPAQNNHPCLPLDEKATIRAMKIMSTSILTLIAGLSTYSAETVAPLARQRLTQEVLLISPYVCMTIALIGVAFSLCASESNGLAEYASVAVLLICLFGIGLGASAVAIMLHAAHQSVIFWTYVLIVATICAWGWLFTYPRCLKSLMTMLYWDCFDQRRSTNPWRAAYANPGTGQHIDRKGFRNILSDSLASCRRAFVPLDEDKTIDALKLFSPPVLTAICTLSFWAAHSVAPKAYSMTMQRFLYTVPYFYPPFGVVAVALLVSASKSNGLASYASSIGLGLCVFGVGLGASCCIVVLHSGRFLTALVAAVMVVALFCGWGWMFAYPKILNWAMRKTICRSCARRMKIVPLGRFQGCGRSYWTWIFRVLKIIGLYLLHLQTNVFVACLNIARGWWGALHARFSTAELQLIPVTRADLLGRWP